MNSLFLTPFRYVLVLLVAALFISGCSSSSDSTSGGSQSSSEVSDTTNGDGVNADDGATGNANNAANLTSGEESAEEANSATESDSATSDNDEALIVDTTDASEDETTIPVDLNTENSSSVGSDATEIADSAVVPDPMFQNRTQVDFVITVPVYQSSALQVRLNWGEIDMTASWVGDELWSASVELPTDTEQTLNVTFYDNNGALKLASFEQAYRTGNNAFETYTIATEQFNAQLFDADEDGENNLDELIAGTNPLVNEAAELEVRDSYSVESIQLVSAYYEQTISNERPYSHRVEELPPADAGFDMVRRTHIVTIDIDELGNGTVSDNYEYRDTNDSDITAEKQEGTRTKIEDSVLWVGTYRRSNSGSQVSETIDFSIETSAIDGQTRQTGTIQRGLSGRGRLDFEQELSYSLVGERTEDSTMCTPVTGTVTNKYSYPSPNTLTVATKESDDTLWSVLVTSHDGDFIERYSVRLLDVNFYCDFADL